MPKSLLAAAAVPVVAAAALCLPAAPAQAAPSPYGCAAAHTACEQSDGVWRYWSGAASASAATTRALADTSDPSGPTGGAKLRPGAPLTLATGLPEGSLAIVRLTPTGQSEAGSFTVYPCGARPPRTVSASFDAGTSPTVTAAAEVGPGGQVCLATTAEAHVAVALDAASHRFDSYTNERVFDTRSPIYGAARVTSATIHTYAPPGSVVYGTLTTLAAGVQGHIDVVACAAGDPDPAKLSTGASLGGLEPAASFQQIRTDANGDFCVATDTPAHIVFDQVADAPAAAVPGGRGVAVEGVVDLAAGPLQLHLSDTGQATVLSTLRLAGASPSGPAQPGTATVYPCLEGPGSPSSRTFAYADWRSRDTLLAARTDNVGNLCVAATGSAFVGVVAGADIPQGFTDMTAGTVYTRDGAPADPAQWDGAAWQPLKVPGMYLVDGRGWAAWSGGQWLTNPWNPTDKWDLGWVGQAYLTDLGGWGQLTAPLPGPDGLPQWAALTQGAAYRHGSMASTPQMWTGSDWSPLTEGRYYPTPQLSNAPSIAGVWTSGGWADPAHQPYQDGFGTWAYVTFVNSAPVREPLRVGAIYPFRDTANAPAAVWDGAAWQPAPPGAYTYGPDGSACTWDGSAFTFVGP